MMFVIFFVIDRANPAMEFLTRQPQQVDYPASCALRDHKRLVSAVYLFRIQKRRDEKRNPSHVRSSQV